MSSSGAFSFNLAGRLSAHPSFWLHGQLPSQGQTGAVPSTPDRAHPEPAAATSECRQMLEAITEQSVIRCPRCGIGAMIALLSYRTIAGLQLPPDTHDLPQTICSDLPTGRGPGNLCHRCVLPAPSGHLQPECCRFPLRFFLWTSGSRLFLTHPLATT